MKAIVNHTQDREITISGTVSEFADLYEALTAERKTKAVKEALQEFGDMMVVSDSAIRDEIANRDFASESQEEEQTHDDGHTQTKAPVAEPDSSEDGGVTFDETATG